MLDEPWGGIVLFVLYPVKNTCTIPLKKIFAILGAHI
jgi:hypothetical protein